MSHDTHHGHTAENKAKISFGNGFWLVIILVGLFIAALNFIQVESAGEGHEGGHGEATHQAHGGGHEAAPAAGHNSHGEEAVKDEQAAGTPAHEAAPAPAGETAPAEQH
jgi:uncharacterized iron-regulated membrane protein